MKDKDLSLVESFTKAVESLAKEYDVDCVVAAKKISSERGTSMVSISSNGSGESKIVLDKLISTHYSNRLSDVFNPSPNSDSSKL